MANVIDCGTYFQQGIALKTERARAAVENPLFIEKELQSRSFFRFMKYFWDTYSSETFQSNWHIELMCAKLQAAAERVGKRWPKKFDIVINVPPGSTKTATCMIMFPVWCWTRWFWMRFITASYSSQLALESADYSREIIRSSKFKEIYFDLSLKADKDQKSNYQIVKRYPNGVVKIGGNRFSTGVGTATATGFHGHFLLVDDPLNPHQATSEKELKAANHWMSNTLSTRKVDKRVTVTLLIQQRLHQSDPSGQALEARPEEIDHLCLPGDCIEYGEYVHPPELKSKYSPDGLLDPVRMDRDVLHSLKLSLGQYGYAGQIGQHPVPPGGGMFKIGRFQIVDDPKHLLLPHQILGVVRYWDKAGTQDGGAATAGVKMYMVDTSAWGKKFVITDVKRDFLSSEAREQLIRKTAEADGVECIVYHEQEPGSGGKDSASQTTKNLHGFVAIADKPTGDKIYRADPYSVSVNEGSVVLVRGDWNKAFIDEHSFFPNSTYKDQVDAASGAYMKLNSEIAAGTW